MTGRKGGTRLHCLRVQDLGQGMTLAVGQLNLPSRTVSGRRDYRRTKQHRRKYLHRPRVYIVSMRFGNQTMTISNWHYYEFTLIFRSREDVQYWHILYNL